MGLLVAWCYVLFFNDTATTEIYPLSLHDALPINNTGDGAKARAEHLKDIDRAALPSVTAAQGAMKQLQQHRREERQHEWEEKQQQRQRDRDEKQWPTKPPQPERQSW